MPQLTATHPTPPKTWTPVLASLAEFITALGTLVVTTHRPLTVSPWNRSNTAGGQSCNPDIQKPGRAAARSLVRTMSVVSSRSGLSTPDTAKKV